MLVINIIMLIVLNIEAALYNLENATKIFNFFKDKYHKVYINETMQHRAYENFVKNLNEVDALNGKTSGSDTFYVLNKYADVNQGDFEEHYALDITPYDKTTVHREFSAPNDGLRNRIERKPDAKSVEQIDLYDLDNADNLYKKYMQDFNKKNSTKEYDRTVHYYRFLKTLVEMNKAHYKGIKKKLDASADIVKKPYDYFY